MASYFEIVGRLVTDHPWNSLFFGFLYAVIIVLIYSKIIRPLLGESFSNVLVTSPTGALDRTWGTCISEAGREHCGSAEGFKTTHIGDKKYISAGSSSFADMSGRKAIRASRQPFLGGGGSGPDFTSTAAADSDYWYGELNGTNGGDASDSGADAVDASMTAAQAAQHAVAAVQAGAIHPAAAAAVASQFAAMKHRQQRFSADDMLMSKARGH